MAASYLYAQALYKFLGTDFRKATEDEIQRMCCGLKYAISKDVRPCIKSSDVQKFLSRVSELLNLAIERSSIKLFWSATMPLRKFFTSTKREIAPPTSYAKIVSVMLAFLQKKRKCASLFLVTLQSVLDKIRVGFSIDLPCPVDFVLTLTCPKNNDSTGTKVALTVVTQLLMHTVPIIQNLRPCLPHLTRCIRGRTEASAEVCLALAAIGYQALKGPKEAAEEMARVGIVEELVRLVEHACTLDRLPVYTGSVLLTLRLLARHGPPLTDRLIACKALDYIGVFISTGKTSIGKNAGMIVSYILGYTGLSSSLVAVRRSLVPSPHAMLLNCGEAECEAITLLLETFLTSPEWEPWFTDNRLLYDLIFFTYWTKEGKKAYVRCLRDALKRIQDERQRCKVREKLEKFEKGFVI